LDNQAKIEEGLKAAWPARQNKKEVSAIQHALNLWKDRGKEVFDAEFQNDPQPEQSGDDWHLPQDKICAKVNGLQRGIVPLWSQKLTAFCDVQQRLLYWMVCAWGENGRGAIIDYGAWPEQPQREFNYLDIRKTLTKAYPRRGIEGAITAGLGDLVKALVEKDWIREVKIPARIDAMGIDSGNRTKESHEFVRTSKHAGILFPTRGRGVTADRRPISEWPRKPNEIIGEEWLLAPQPKHASRLLTYDTNYWKYQLFLKLSAPLGEPGDLSFWGDETKYVHRMVSTQFHSETFQKTEGQGRTVYVFAQKPSRPDNHFLDCAVGNCVMRLNGLRVQAKRRKHSKWSAEYL
jgi:phage terminase large subunit GpA-like protein